MSDAHLRAPDFLGVHTLNLNDELKLEGLSISCGAALHNDQAAALLGTRAAVGDGGADRVFSAAGASGSRILGGAYLRVRAETLRTYMLHIWLSPTRADGSDATPALAGSDAASDCAVHSFGPFRVRVLSAEVVAAGVGGDDGSLHSAESLQVKLAVDRLHGWAPRQARCPAKAQAPLPTAELPRTVFWLSTQGAQAVSIGGQTPDGAPTAAGAGAGEDEGSAAPALRLPPLSASPSAGLPPIAHSDSIDVSLHVAPLRPLAGADEPFGCAPWLWSAELCAIATGSCEAHVAFPLALDDPPPPADQPAAGDAGGAEAEHRIGPYRLRVLRCIGHFVREAGAEADAAAAEGADGRSAQKQEALLSEYPLLLLHVQVALSLACGEDEGEGDELEAEALGAALERMLA